MESFKQVLKIGPPVIFQPCFPWSSLSMGWEMKWKCKYLRSSTFTLNFSKVTRKRKNSIWTQLYLKYLSNNVDLMVVAIADGWPSPNLNTLSMTDNSVLVVSKPQNAIQSFTTMPAPTTSLPLLTVPACNQSMYNQSCAKRLTMVSYL